MRDRDGGLRVDQRPIMQEGAGHANPPYGLRTWFVIALS
jgi:hypothetical protein